MMQMSQKSYQVILFLSLLLVFAFSSPRPLNAQVPTIDLSQLAVIKDTMQTVNQQLQQLQDLTNIQQEVLDAIGEATGLDPNGIIFQGLMELACGKFQLPRIRFNLPMPNIRFPDLPDNLCDWFGYGSGYQSNLWGRAFGSLENAIKYSETMYFINTASDEFNQALNENGNNVYCALWDMRKNVLDSINSNQHGDCPQQYRDNPPNWQPGQPLAVPVEIQLGIRRDRKQAKQASIVFGQGLGTNSVTIAGDSGAQIQKFVDMGKNAEKVQDKLSVQNSIMIKIYEQNSMIISLLGAMLDMQAKQMMENEDITLTATTTQP